jgi:uncharacterized membrane protein
VLAILEGLHPRAREDEALVLDVLEVFVLGLDVRVEVAIGPASRLDRVAGF